MPFYGFYGFYVASIESVEGISTNLLTQPARDQTSMLPYETPSSCPDTSPGTSSARREDLAGKSAKKSLPQIFGTPFSYLYDNTLRL